MVEDRITYGCCFYTWISYSTMASSEFKIPSLSSTCDPFQKICDSSLIHSLSWESEAIMWHVAWSSSFNSLQRSLVFGFFGHCGASATMSNSREDHIFAQRPALFLNISH